MSSYSIRQTALATVPMVTAGLWYLLPPEVQAGGGIWLISALASAVMAAGTIYLTQPLDRTLNWLNGQSPESSTGRVPVEPNADFGAIATRFAECQDHLRESRTRHRDDLEGFRKAIEGLQVTAGLKVTSSGPISVAAAEASLAEIGKQFQGNRARLNQVQALLHSTPAPLVMCDAKGRLKIANQAGEKLFQIAGANLAAKALDQIAAPAEADSPELLAQVRSAPTGRGVAVAQTPAGRVDVRFEHAKLIQFGSEPLYFVTFWDRREELAETARRVREARHDAARFVIREFLEAELPLAEGLQAKARLALGDVKQKAEKQVVVTRLGALLQDADQLANRLALWEWLYRTEWNPAAVPAPSEVSGEAVLQECLKSLAGVFAARKLTVNIVRGSGGWLCVDRDLLATTLSGLLSYAARAAAGNRLEVRYERMAASAELAEGWTSFTVAGDWNPDLWQAEAPEGGFDSLLADEKRADASLGLAVAARVAALLQGSCRPEEEPDGRRVLRLYVPTRLPGGTVSVGAGIGDLEVGPREELCIGWKLGVAV